MAKEKGTEWQKKILEPVEKQVFDEIINVDP